MDFRDVNRHLYINCYDFTEIADLQRLAKYDKYAVDDIASLEKTIADINQYRKELYNHVQSLRDVPYELVLSITRRKMSDGVHFYLSIKKHLENDLESFVLNEHYTGNERAKALARFEQLKKEHNGIKTVKDIEKGRWEK